MEDSQKKACVLLSGGLDSTVLLYWALARYADVVAISFDYHSKHGAMEREAAIAVCRKRDVRNIRIPLDFIARYFHSSLLENGPEIPEGDYSSESISSTVVPFRNGIMLAVAAGFAESEKRETILLANHAGDHPVYPDCRPAFIDAMTGAVREGTMNHVEMLSPFCYDTKTQLVKTGAQLGVDFSLTYSCYRGGKLHCGRCATCRERKNAFALAGVPDPTIYGE